MTTLSRIVAGSVLAFSLSFCCAYAADKKLEREFGGKYKGKHKIQNFGDASGNGFLTMPKGKGKATPRGGGDGATFFVARVTKVTGSRKRLRYRGMAEFDGEDEFGPFRATATRKKGSKKALTTSWSIPSFEISGGFKGSKKR